MINWKSSVFNAM